MPLHLRHLLLAVAAFAAEPATAMDVQILSAVVKDQVIQGAEVIVQRDGEASRSTTTDAKGKAKVDVIAAKDDPATTVIVKKPGYSNLVVRCPCDGLTYAISPKMESLDGLRIVLDWGATPKDLDGHLVFSGSHVYFNDKKGDAANLDVDDTDSYGPETITIDTRRTTPYVFAVQNYTESTVKGSRKLSSSSHVKVFVYVGSTLVRTFVPQDGAVGNTWVVFGITSTGEFFDVNRFADVEGTMGVEAFLKKYLSDGDFKSAPNVSVDQKTLADQQNRRGEEAYHAGRLDVAELLYRQAINNNPEHSQAYSNLGLLYLKMGLDSEAVWANRKAISLAAGKSAKTVKAASHYNIAKTYEKQGQYQLALDEYTAAQALKTNKAYSEGIARMNKELRR